MAELLRHEPLFPAKTELGILEMMAKLLGSPNEAIWPVCAYHDREGCLVAVAMNAFLPHQVYSCSHSGMCIVY